MKLPRLIVLVFMVLSIVVWLHPTPSSNAQDNTACESDSIQPRARYDLVATLDWNTKITRVQQTVTYRNDFSTPLTELVFHSEPHRLSQVPTMTGLSAYAADEQFIEGIQLNEMRLSVPLNGPINRGCEVTVRLEYELNITPLSDTNPLGWLAYTERQVNLGFWFPVVGLYSYEADGLWYTPERHYIGEQAVTEIADFTARLQVNNAPANLTMAAPGKVALIEPNTWQIEFKAGRDLSLSFSTNYRLKTATVGNTTIDLYTFNSTYVGSESHALESAQQALELYNSLFGVYPDERLVIVEGDFPDGMELSGLVFVGSAWFTGWDGTLTQYLTYITVHEVAHQWWYRFIGSDGGQHPYLDEALCVLSELLYVEHYYPDAVSAWWNFRVNRFSTEDPVDVSVYEYTQWRPYINAVYLKGVKMLTDSRQTVGYDIFMQWLKDYATAYWGKNATPQDFWGILPIDAYNALIAIRQQYLRNPDVLP